MKTLNIALLAAALAACSQAKPVADAAPKAAPAPQAAPAPAPAAPAKAETKIASVPVPNDSLYFDYDKSEVKAAAKNELADLGGMLAKNPSLAVRIEGNCDERGTEEYNIALGQRRADAAKKYLQTMGAAAKQVSTISYGKDRPKAKGHDEDAWRENRRDDVIPNQATVQPPVSANP